jgi:hypothetical protein
MLLVSQVFFLLYQDYFEINTFNCKFGFFLRILYYIGIKFCLFRTSRIALVFVGEGRYVEMVGYILKNGGSPNDANKQRESPLFIIIHKAKYRPTEDVLTVLKLLLEHGANPNLGNSDKHQLVAAIHTLNVKATEILLQNGANMNELLEGPTALHVLYKLIFKSRNLIRDHYGKTKNIYVCLWRLDRP